MRKNSLVRDLSAVLSIILLSGCCIFCGKPEIFTASNSGETFKGTTGDSFSVALKSNPTTGYNWEILSYDKNMIKLEDSKYKTDSKLMGAGGTQTYYFKITAPGTTHLKIVYHRPWEKDKAPIDTFELNIITE